MKLKYALLVTIPATLLLCFQNCGTKPGAQTGDDNSTSSVVVEPTAVPKVTMESIYLKDLSDGSTVTDAVLKTGHTYQFGLKESVPAGVVLTAAMNYSKTSASCSLSAATGGASKWNSTCAGEGTIGVTATLKQAGYADQVLDIVFGMKSSPPTPTATPDPANLPELDFKVAADSTPIALQQFKIDYEYQQGTLNKAPQLVIALASTAKCQLGTAAPVSPSRAIQYMTCSPGTLVLQGSQEGVHRLTTKSFEIPKPSSLVSLIPKLSTKEVFYFAPDPALSGPYNTTSIPSHTIFFDPANSAGLYKSLTMTHADSGTVCSLDRNPDAGKNYVLSCKNEGQVIVTVKFAWPDGTATTENFTIRVTRTDRP